MNDTGHRYTSPEERAYLATKKFVRELFLALELDADLDPATLEEEIESTTTVVVNRLDERLQERFGEFF